MLDWMQAGHTAVITGGANGIGLATAMRFAASDMNLALIDADQEALDHAKKELDNIGSGSTRTYVCDVADFAAVKQTSEAIFAAFGTVDYLMNNAGAVLPRHKPWEGLEDWKRQVDINLWGIIHSCQAFLPTIIEAGKHATVINTGSKQGITNPPGGYAYNLSKAGVLSYTQSLAHELRTDELPINVHLLVPGFTYSKMIARFVPEQPAGAWSCEQVTDFMLEAIAADKFYIICPDNDTPPELDAKRIQWNTDDLILGRPALSRWHPDFADDYNRFIE